jgi:hypothetical protein
LKKENSMKKLLLMLLTAFSLSVMVESPTEARRYYHRDGGSYVGIGVGTPGYYGGWGNPYWPYWGGPGFSIGFGF